MLTPEPKAVYPISRRLASSRGRPISVLTPEPKAVYHGLYYWSVAGTPRFQCSPLSRRLCTPLSATSAADYPSVFQCSPLSRRLCTHQFVARIIQLNRQISVLTPEPKAVYRDQSVQSPGFALISVLTPEPKAVYQAVLCWDVVSD